MINQSIARYHDRSENLVIKRKNICKPLDKYPARVYNRLEEIPHRGIQGVLFMIEKECCCKSVKKSEAACCERKKKRSEEEFKSLMNRLKRIEGQVRGVEKMLENDAYCPDILVQVSAINSALNSFNKELLASHMKSCVVNDIRAGNDEVIDELVTTLQKIMK